MGMKRGKVITTFSIFLICFTNSLSEYIGCPSYAQLLNKKTLHKNRGYLIKIYDILKQVTKPF